MTIIVIHGAQGSGKSRRSAELLKHYGCSQVVEGWDGIQHLPNNSLALTNVPPPYRQAGILAVTASAAKCAIGV